MRRRRWAPCPAPPHPQSSAKHSWQGALMRVWACQQPGEAGGCLALLGAPPLSWAQAWPPETLLLSQKQLGLLGPSCRTGAHWAFEHRPRRGMVWKPPPAQEKAGQSRCWGLGGTPRSDWVPVQVREGAHTQGPC